MPDRLLKKWVAMIFDHPVSDPAWYWEIDAPCWEGSPAEVALLIAETFERSGELLAPYSDAQLNQGLWHLIQNASAEYAYVFTDPEIPFPLRVRTLRSFVPLFEQAMAARCSPHLAHLDEREANPLNSVCYMWWDVIPIHGMPEDPGRRDFDQEVLAVFQCLLAIPHDACRESALHGLGHWAFSYSVAPIIDAFLAQTPGLRPELAAYARKARDGDVL